MSQDDRHHHFTRSSTKSLLPVIVTSHSSVELQELNLLETTSEISDNILRIAPQIILNPLIAENSLITEQVDIIVAPDIDSETHNPNFYIIDDQDSDSIEDNLQDNLDDNLQDNLDDNLDDNLNNLHTVDTDSEDEMTSTGLPAPPIFGGDTSVQCPQDWLRTLQYWVAYKSLTADQIKAAIPVLLKDSALIFYQGLPDASKDTLEHFSVPFLHHFKTEGTLPWIDLAALWSYKQSPNQSVEKYLTEISKLALRAEAPAEQVLQAALSGLSPHIRSQLILHQIADMNELRGKALLAEKPSPPPPPATVDATDALQIIQRQLATMAVQSTVTDKKDKTPDRQNQTANGYNRSRDRSRDQSRDRNDSRSRDTSRGRSPYYNDQRRQVSFDDQRGQGQPRREML